MKHRAFEEWLAEFVRYNQDGDVAQRFVTPDGYRLGSWVHSVRNGKYRLTESQKQQLNEVGFRWKGMSWRKRTFNEWFEDFVKYNKNGDVVQKFVTPDGYKLGSWVHSVRNDRYRLTETQKQRLNEVGFRWKGMSCYKRTFDEWIEDFVKYNEDGDVARNFITPEGHWLGVWVSNVRIRENRLPYEVRYRLEEVGFKWKTKRNRTFEEWLWDFIEYNQNGRVPHKYVTPAGYALGSWVYGVKKSIYKLTDEQKQILNEAGFDWSSVREFPERNFDEWMVDFKKYSKNGYIPVKFVTPEGYRLGVWAQNVRAGKYSLTEAQIERLNEVEFKWKVRNSGNR